MLKNVPKYIGLKWNDLEFYEFSSDKNLWYHKINDHVNLTE